MINMIIINIIIMAVLRERQKLRERVVLRGRVRAVLRERQ